MVLKHIFLTDGSRRVRKRVVPAYLSHRQIITLFTVLLFMAVIKPAIAKEPEVVIAADTVFVKGTTIPVAIGKTTGDVLILTPKPGASPQINGPDVYGCRPGNPFIYRIPATGKRPMTFSAKGLPSGLVLDAKQGIITGSVACAGNYRVVLTAKNGTGQNSKSFEIICGKQLALTPPMGWNDWYAHFNRITGSMMKQAADILVKSGMADAGYQYINIDDCWMNAQKSDDKGRVGPPRDTSGKILPNTYFPDMKGLTAYIHSKGLKAGIYTSPGVTTCGGFTGSYGYEASDAKQFADWGFDFLKYDYCSYEQLESHFKAATPGITHKQIMQRPYLAMGALLQSQHRDIVFNLCQYGRDEVWKWGEEVGNSWRTAGDLGEGDELKRLFEVALKNAALGKWVKPGAWNDPDYIQIGYEGSSAPGGLPTLTTLTPAEQYSFMSLWCLMAAPLFYSGDLTKLNDFTLNILCNTEVIAIDQDRLGRCAKIVDQTADTFVMIKDLADGTRAVGLCNKGNTPLKITANLQNGGASHSFKVRDLWRQRDLGMVSNQYTAIVPARGVVLVKVSALNKK